MHQTSSPAPSGIFRILSKPVIICALLAATLLTVYWPVTGYEFISLDDPVYVSENPRVLSGWTWENVRWAFHTVEGGAWHPLTWLSLILDGAMFGARPGGYHLTNVLLHLANTLLLFGLLRRWTVATWRSATVAALFALHPIHVESVAWVSERKDVLSTVFWMLTLWAYGRYAAMRNTATGNCGFKAGVWYGASLSLFALGLMSKPMLVTLPMVMLLLDYWPLQRLVPLTNQVSNIPQQFQTRTLGQLLWEKAPFLLLSAGASVITVWAQRKSEAMASLEWAPMGGRIANALISYARYLGKTFWPTDLAVYYPHRWDWPWLSVVSAGGLVVGVSVAALKCGRRHPFLVTGWFWFVGTLVPVIGLVQVGAQSMADRYTYVPLIGLFVVLIWGAHAILTGRTASRNRKQQMGIAAILILITCSLQTMKQVRYWKNSETIFRHTLAVTHDNEMAHNNLAAWLINHGQPEEGMEHCRLALRLNPQSIPALNNYGFALAREGKLAEATEQFRRSIEARPDDAEVLNNLGLALVLQSRADEAIGHLRRALELQPTHPQILHNLGLAMAVQGQSDEAILRFEEALRIQPDYFEAQARLGQVLAKIGRRADAIRHLSEALQLQPGNPEVEGQLRALGVPVP